MDELEEIRQKTLEKQSFSGHQKSDGFLSELEEIKHQREAEFQERIQIQQQVSQLETAAKMWMDAEAVSRYGNIKAAHPEKALQVAVLIAQFVQSGKIKKLITDEQLKELLVYLDEKKQNTKINIQRK
ncbi:MAG: DNA-binding protein [Candidatus Nanoarchaeia archaeon]|jgi:DNA-binding TFAR19-related protein (PDSD5 family)